MVIINKIEIIHDENIKSPASLLAAKINTKLTLHKSEKCNISHILYKKTVSCQLSAKAPRPYDINV